MNRKTELAARSRDPSAGRAPAWPIRAGYALGTIVCGLALRRLGPGLGLPFPLVKYGGSLLWGTMLFFLVASVPVRLSRRRVTVIAAIIAIGVELFRLFRVPWLDAFRLTPIGALLLGRVFSPWNLLAYGCGIVLAIGIDRFVTPAGIRPPRHSPN